jgi:hypothetical protein
MAWHYQNLAAGFQQVTAAQLFWQNIPLPLPPEFTSTIISTLRVIFYNCHKINLYTDNCVTVISIQQK